MADPDASPPADPRHTGRTPGQPPASAGERDAAEAPRAGGDAEAAPERPAGTGMDTEAGTGEGAPKPAILQESHFIVEEGILHRTFRTGAIWLNKLFFSAAALWAIWLLLGYSQGLQDCAGGIGQQGNNSSHDFESVADGTCSVLLTTTSKYLGAMTLVSFLGSVGLGLLGLMVGKRVIEMTPTEEEAGSEEHAQAAASAADADARAGSDQPASGESGDRQ